MEKALKKTPGADELLALVVGFFGAFYESSIKLNTSVYRTVFTGVFRILKGTVGTSTNNFSEYYLLSKEFARDFGFIYGLAHYARTIFNIFEQILSLRLLSYIRPVY